MSNSMYDWQQIFADEIEYILFLNDENSFSVNHQSFDCDKLLIKIKDRNTYLCLANNHGSFIVQEMQSYDADAFSLKHIPPKNAHISFVGFRTFDDGDYVTEELKFTYCDRYLFIFTDEAGWLITTISVCDLFEDDDESMIENEDSDLYLERV